MHAEQRPAYVIEEGDATRDRDAILTAWSGHFGPDEEHAGKLAHFYEHCPFGTPIIRLLRHVESGQVAGVIAAVPRRMLLDGGDIRAAVISHFSVLPAHRTLGPALMLQAAIVDACKGRFDFIYGIPNPKATAILKRAGHRTLCQFGRYVKVLRYGQYLSRVMPALLARPLAPLVNAAVRLRHALRAATRAGTRCHWSDTPDPRMDAVWRDSDTSHGLLAVRDTTLAKWRFNTAPSERMRFLLVTHGERLCAWFACEDSTGSPGTLSVLDYWFADNALAKRRHAIKVLLDRAVADGHTAVDIAMTGARHARDGWLAERFVHRSDAPVMGRWLHPDDPAPDSARIHMTYSDQDS
jgi:hypothetical protein